MFLLLHQCCLKQHIVNIYEAVTAFLPLAWDFSPVSGSVSLKTVYILFSFKRKRPFLIIAPREGGDDSGQGNVAR